MTPDRPRSSRSLQDLRHIRSELQALRDQEKAREQALAQQRLQQQAQRNQFASAVGAVQPLRGDHARRVLHRPEPVSPQPRQRERDHAAVLHEALSDSIDTSSLLETDEQLSYLKRSGCDMGQGYLFSRPLPADQLIAFIGQHNS